jgi:hypothetical protein
MAEILRKNSMLYPLLIGLVFFMLFPQITEHVEFAKILVGEIEYDQYNSLDKRAKEFSSQIIIPAVLIDFGVNGFLLQLLMSFLLTCIPFYSIFYISQAMNPGDASSAIKLFVIASIILFVVEMTNLNSYPVQFPISYAEFGNSGMWVMLLIVGLLLSNKPIAGLFIGFLFSWHLIWFFGTIIFVFMYFAKESNRKSYEKIIKFSILFVLGCLLSFFLYKIGMSYKDGAMVDENYGLFQIARNMLSEPELVLPNLSNGHNIHMLSSGLRGALEKLFFLLFPLFFIMINSKNMSVSVFVNKIKAPLVLLSIVSFCFIFYLELARFVALPGAETLVSRAILNRYLNVNIVISIILIIQILIKFMENKSRKSFEIYEVLFLMISSVFLVGYLLVLVSILLYFLFLVYNYLSGKTFLLNHVRDSLSKIIVFVFFVLIFMKVSALHQAKYSLYSYFSPTDDVFLYLSEYEGNKSIVLGPTIPAIHSLNVGFLTDRDYYQMRDDVRDHSGAISNLYCQISNYEVTVGGVKECFEKRSTKQWVDILELHNSNLVVVTSDIKLNIELEASNKYFSIYKVEK